MDLLMVAQPTGLWESILFALESWIGNYAIAIILITIIIKLVLLPIEFCNKYITKKNGIKQAEMKPELEKINQRYGNNKDLVNKKTMELYKQKGYSIGGMCGIMLGYMAVTMIVFFTLLSSLNNISYYKMYTEYESISTTYYTTYEETVADNPEFDSAQFESLEVYADHVAGDATIEKFGEVKTGFLWIKSIWRPDTSNSPVLDYKTFNDNVSKLEDVEVPTEEEYNKVMGALMQSEEYSSWNGYYILCIVAALATFGSNYINTLVQKSRAKKKGVMMETMEQGGKGLNIIMPIIMGLFTLFYTASFGLYVVTSSLFAMVTGTVMSIFVDRIIEKQLRKERKKTTNSYDRKNI